jgi:hypothetical protein
MYFSSDDKGEFSAMVWNWPGEEVRCFYPVCRLFMTLPKGCLVWTVFLAQFYGVEVLLRQAMRFRRLH